MTPLEAYLAQVKEREAKATPGQWLREGKTVYALQHHGWRKGIETFENRTAAHFQGKAPDHEHESNAEFCQLARTDVPALARLVEVLMEWAERCHASLCPFTDEDAGLQA